MENNEDKIYSVSVIGKKGHLFITVFQLRQTNFNIMITETISGAIKIHR